MNKWERKLWFQKNKGKLIKRGTIILSVLLLVVGVIYITYSKFESTQEFTIINGKVVDNGDLKIISYEYDGSKHDTPPENNGTYFVQSVDCNNANGSWNNDDWGVNVKNITGKVKCGVSFKKCSEIVGNVVLDQDYTGNEVRVPISCNGNYKIELWGAQGGGYSSYIGGKGAYVKGNIYLKNTDIVYVFVGGQGQSVTYSMWSANPYNNFGGYNGGGNAYNADGSISNRAFGSGGGATDIRIFSSKPTTNDLIWNSAIGLNSRIMVAAGGGGAFYSPSYGGDAGGLTGYNGTQSEIGGTSYCYGEGATQISGGIVTSNCSWDTLIKGGSASYFGVAQGGGSASGGGSGFYAGGRSAHAAGAGGGSSYISGHTGCVAIKENSTSEPREVKKSNCLTGTSDNECSIHYSNRVFTNTQMIDGKGYAWTNQKASTATGMPNHNDTSTIMGNQGNGYAKVIYLGN